MKTQPNKMYEVLFPLCFLISYRWCLKNVLVSVHLFWIWFPYRAKPQAEGLWAITLLGIRAPGRGNEAQGGWPTVVGKAHGSVAAAMAACRCAPSVHSASGRSLWGRGGHEKGNTLSTRFHLLLSEILAPEFPALAEIQANKLASLQELDTFLSSCLCGLWSLQTQSFLSMWPSLVVLTEVLVSHRLYRWGQKSKLTCLFWYVIYFIAVFFLRNQ